TVTGYTPAPTTGSRAMNGCMINPAIGDHVGFDSLGGDSYDPDLNCATDLPVTLAPGDSMLIAVSIASATERKGHLDHVIVLTVVAEVPPEDAFRPAYAGSSFQTIYRYEQVDTSRLAR